MKSYRIQIANSSHHVFAEEICNLIAQSASQRGTGISKRSPDYLINKMQQNQGIIATTSDNKLVGFCYIESWEDKKYVANSGLIVHPDYRGSGIAKMIKQKAFEHSKKLFPNAKLFGLTTSLPVMKINSKLGYFPVTYQDLTKDDDFWKGCQSCVNHPILMSKNKKNCLCTAMLYDPENHTRKWNFSKKIKIYERLSRIKFTQFKIKKNNNEKNSVSIQWGLRHFILRIVSFKRVKI